MKKCSSAVLMMFLSIIGSKDVSAQKYVPINATAKEAIYQAAIKNRTDLLQKYHDLRYNIDSVDSEGMTALCSALKNRENRAYHLLISFGANPNHSCVQQVQQNTAEMQNAKNTKMWWTAGLAGGGAALAIAMSSGGHGGGGGDDSGGGSGGGGSGGGEDEKPKDFTPYSAEYFNGDAEYMGSYFGADSVKYLSSINAAPAFATVYGADKNGNFATTLNPIKVGVIDTGVWGNHEEFMLNGESKISGANYDYGPCLNGDTQNCWKPVGEQVCEDNSCVQNMELMGTTQTGEISCDGLYCNAYNEWKDRYPADYDWDNMKNYYYPNLSADDDNALHGTNVTGIIVSNHNGKGNMGIVPLNTSVSAMRWDFVSDMGYPLRALREQGDILAINMSLGVDAEDSSHAEMARTDLSDFDAVELNELKNFISDYSDPAKMHTIFVKAAGNESYNDADLWSGIKLNPEYSDLLMLVVMAVDVSFNDDMSIRSYSRSNFSNYCGSTKGYCLAAPGGTETIIGNKLIYSAGDPTSEYEGMGGTSQATPMVTGAIAFLKGKFNYLTSEQIVDLLLTTANKISADTYSEEIYGAGLLDLYAAMQYVPTSGNAVTTVSGSSISGPKVTLSGSRLSLPAGIQSSVLNALPKTITVFDKYNRPFGVHTANYVSANHSGYRNFKNDVLNISRRKPKTYSEGNMKLSFGGSSWSGNKSNLGFASAEYKGEKSINGFYFSDNTSYQAIGSMLKEMHNPFMSFNNAYSAYNISNLTDKMALKTEISMGRNGLYDGERSFNDASFKKSAYAFNTELQLHKNKNFAFGISSGWLYEDEAMLGTNGEGAFAVQDSGTYNAGVNASWFITPKITLSGAYYRGYTQGQNFGSDLLSTSGLQSESFAFDANYKYNSDMDFGLRLSSPLRITSGKMFVNFPSGRDNYSDSVYREQFAASLKPQAREYKLAAYFNREVNENISFSTEAGVRFNPEHRKQSNDYRALFGLNWNF